MKEKLPMWVTQSLPKHRAALASGACFWVALGKQCRCSLFSLGLFGTYSITSFPTVPVPPGKGSSEHRLGGHLPSCCLIMEAACHMSLNGETVYLLV